MAKKKKKEPKVEQLFDNASESENIEEKFSKDVSEMSDDEKLILGVEIDNEDELTEEQKDQLEKLDAVKDKISKILKSSNIEIVDENIGDEYDNSSSPGSPGKQQQDYDSLKALFGGEDDKKSKEVTLTIDDYDYTYTGQYLDEFDMVHLKNIKRIRLQSKYAKKIKKISLIASIVICVIGGAIGAFFMLRETPVYLKSISLNHSEGDYYVNDCFNYAGLYIIAEYSDGKFEKIKLDSNHLTSTIGNISKDGDVIQFTGTAPAELKFQYGGLTTTYNVKISNKSISGMMAIYSDGLFNLEAGDKINADYLRILYKYSNFNPTFVVLDSNFTLYINDVQCVYDSISKSFIASQSTKPFVAGELSTATIKIESDVYSLIITDVEGRNLVETE